MKIEKFQRNNLVALDADGVLLDYGLAYASAWEKAFGVYPKERDRNAYWPMDRWEVKRLSGAQLQHFRTVFDETFWSAIPALPGATEACQRLASAGFDLVCVTALAEQHAEARSENLRSLGFPLQAIYTIDVEAEGPGPKAKVINRLRPEAFVDDYLPYFVGIDRGIHLALVTRESNGSPNSGDLLGNVSSVHSSLLDFSNWWLSNRY